MSRTGFGISICRSALTSWPISAIWKEGAKDRPALTGLLVPGCSTGGGGDGRSATMLYQEWGIFSSPRRYLVSSLKLSSLPAAPLPSARPRLTV